MNVKNAMNACPDLKNDCYVNDDTMLMNAKNVIYVTNVWLKPQHLILHLIELQLNL